MPFPSSPAETYRTLLQTMCASLGVEQSLYELFHFLHVHIPFERALCYNIDRRKRLMTLFIDYTAHSYVKESQSMKLVEMLDWKDLVHGFFDKEHKITLDNNVQSTQSIFFTYSQNFPQPFGSLLAIMLHAAAHPQKEKRLHTLFLLNSKPDAFTEDHVQLLATLRDPLQQLTHSFFLTDAEPRLHLTTEGPLPSSPEALLRRCPGLETVMRLVDVVAPMANTVLIQGPTGVGKELVADTLHNLSPRCARPFIKVNCGAIPETLVDSEFFGFEKGAFTGAVSSRPGYFEQAQGGSIYLDEIGELSLNAQTRLLRVLENQEVRRVGGTRRIPLDVRIIAATHRDLWAMTRRGAFREDLCYRLHVFPIAVPPLCERPGDIPVLVDYFYRLYVKKSGLDSPPVLSHRTVRELMARSWPGNVRQLRYAVEQALLRSLAAHSPEMLFAGEEKTRPAPPSKPVPTTAAQIRQALRKAGGRIQGQQGAAALLGVSPSTLRNRMRALGITLPRQRKAGPPKR